MVAAIEAILYFVGPDIAYEDLPDSSTIPSFRRSEDGGYVDEAGGRKIMPYFFAEGLKVADVLRAIADTRDCCEECGASPAGFVETSCGGFDHRGESLPPVFHVLCEDCWLEQHTSQLYTEADAYGIPASERHNFQDKLWYRGFNEREDEEGWFRHALERDD
jgi:hypothetical protein